MFAKKEKKFYQKKYYTNNKETKTKVTITPPKGFKKASLISHKINASDTSKIQNGMRVKHSKFGKGKILEISGENINKKATIFFENIGQKQLLLRFAKLEILK